MCVLVGVNPIDGWIREEVPESLVPKPPGNCSSDGNSEEAAGYQDMKKIIHPTSHV